MTQLSMPLAGLAPAAVLERVRAGLDGDERVIAVNETPPQPDPLGRPAEHVQLDLHFAAGSAAHGHLVASELHDRALQCVLAAAPASRGWTSSFAEPELDTAR
jgi:hypothetical protein